MGAQCRKNRPCMGGEMTESPSGEGTLRAKADLRKSTQVPGTASNVRRAPDEFGLDGFAPFSNHCFQFELRNFKDLAGFFFFVLFVLFLTSSKN